MQKKCETTIKKLEVYKSLFWLWPVYAVVFFLPIMVYGTSMTLKGVYADFANQANHIDVFVFFRSNFIVIMAFMSLIMCVLYCVEQKKVGKSLVLILGAFVYLLAIIVSTYFSTWRVIAIFGFLDRFEGALVLVSYIILFVTTYVLTFEKKQIQVLIALMLLSSSFVAIIGVLQFFEVNIFSSDFFQKMILGGTPLDLNSLEIAKSEAMVYSTLYNSNYVGSFVALVFPISLGLYICSKQKLQSLILGAHSTLIFALIVACRSRAGVMGLIFAVTILIFSFRKSLITNKKKGFIVLIYLIIFLGMNDYSNGGVLAKLITLNPRIEQDVSQSDRTEIHSIQFDKNGAQIVTDTHFIELKRSGESLVFLNSKGEPLVVKPTSKGYVFKDAAFDSFRYNVYSNVGSKIVALEIKRLQLNFLLNTEGVYIIGSQNKLYNKMPQVASFGFKGRESLGSGRGYIWSRTFPILKDTLLWGHGPDTFALYFPQHDYLGKLSVMRSASYIVDKPHNFYLQLFHDTGGISLIAFFMLIGNYFYRAFFMKKRYFEDSFDKKILSILTCSVLAYLTAAIFNDSVVFVAPFFWIILGLGFSVSSRYVEV